MGLAPCWIIIDATVCRRSYTRIFLRYSKPEGLDHSTLYDLFSRNVKSYELQRATEALIESGEYEEISEMTDGKPRKIIRKRVTKYTNLGGLTSLNSYGQESYGKTIRHSTSLRWRGGLS